MCRFALRLWVGVLTLAMPWSTFRPSTDIHPKTGTQAPIVPKKKK